MGVRNMSSRQPKTGCKQAKNIISADQNDGQNYKNDTNTVSTLRYGVY